MEEPQFRRLSRSRDRKIAGVAGGIAEYFALDPTIVRLLFVIALFANGLGLVAYVVMWIVMPQAPAPADGGARPAVPGSAGTTPAVPRHRGGDAALFVGVALMALGALLLLNEFAVYQLGLAFARFSVPVLLLAAGLWLLLRRSRAAG